MKKKNEIVINEGDILIDGTLWTDYEFHLSINSKGINIYVSGNIIICDKQEIMPNVKGNFWISGKDLPLVNNIVAYSKIFINNRYNLKDKRYDRGAIKDLRVIKSEIS
jgi:hypothetical protein